MARPSTALRRFAVVSVTVFLSGIAAGATGSAVAFPHPAARVAPTPLLPAPYVVILHPEGLVANVFDGVL